MLESYKELISAKAEIKMLKKQLEEAGAGPIHCKDCGFARSVNFGEEDPRYVCIHPEVGGIRKADFFCAFCKKKVEP